MTPTPTAEVFPFSVSFCLSVFLSRTRSSVSTKGGGRSLSSSRSSPSFSSPPPCSLATSVLLFPPFSAILVAFRETRQSRKLHRADFMLATVRRNLRRCCERFLFLGAAFDRLRVMDRRVNTVFHGNLRSSPEIEFPDPTQLIAQLLTYLVMIQ